MFVEAKETQRSAQRACELPMPPKKGRLDKLECLRGFAAVYVMAGHIAPDSRMALPLRFGQEAVILFFVLSGFVIHYSSCLSRKPEPFRIYLIRRARRIYPLFLMALVWSWGWYCVLAGGLTPPPWRDLVGNLLMLQDLPWLKVGTWFQPFCGNAPLWSLAYEWWFYLLFYPILFGVADSRRRGVVALLGLAGFVLGRWLPNPFASYLTYFPIWWAGVELSREYGATGRVSWRGQWPSLATLSGLALLWVGVAALRWRSGVSMSPGFEPLLQLRHIGTGLILVAGAIAWSKARFVGFAVLTPFRIAAPVSYALYVLHQPALYTLKVRMTPPDLYGALAAAIVVVVLLSYLLEVRLQALVNRLTDRWLSRSVSNQNRVGLPVKEMRAGVR